MRNPDHKDDVVLPGQAENIMGCTPVRVARGSSRGRSVIKEMVQKPIVSRRNMAQVRKELTYACREDKMCLIDKRQRNRFLSSSSSSLSEIVSLMMVLARSNTFIAINHLRHIHHHHHVGAGQMPVLPLPKVSTMWDEEGGRAGGEAARQQVGLPSIHCDDDQSHQDDHRDHYDGHREFSRF